VRFLDAFHEDFQAAGRRREGLVLEADLACNAHCFHYALFGKNSTQLGFCEFWAPGRGAEGAILNHTGDRAIGERYYFVQPFIGESEQRKCQTLGIPYCDQFIRQESRS
jgi:hypothetical protein